MFDVVETCCQWTRPSSAVRMLATAKIRPAQSISMAAATRGRLASFTWRGKTDPIAQHNGAASARAKPKDLMWPVPGELIKHATPHNPVSQPALAENRNRP